MHETTEPFSIDDEAIWATMSRSTPERPASPTFERVSPDTGPLVTPARFCTFTPSPSGEIPAPDHEWRARYRRRSSVLVRPAPPAGPSGLLVVMVDNDDPTDEAGFNAWYDEVHVPDVLASGTYYRATRLVGDRAEAHQAAPRYLAVYETDEDPIAAHAPVTARAASMVMWHALAPRHVADYRRV